MSDVPAALFVLGPAGSGKSTIARALATKLGAVYLDKDTVAGAFVRHGMLAADRNPDAREHDEYYRTVLMPLEYRTLFDVAADNLKLGQTVILDAPFAAYLADPDFLGCMRTAASWPETVRTIVATVAVNQQQLITRLTTRGSERDRWKLANWDQFWEQYGRTTCAWEVDSRIQISNDHAQVDLTELEAVLAS